MNTYFLSWTCYGTWLHGDSRGSVDKDHNKVGDPFLAPDRDHQAEMRSNMSQPAYEMDAPRRKIVLESIRQLCIKRNWSLHAIHVRNNHVHAVVTADRPPERVMHDFKSFASKGLNDAGFESKDRIRWTRGGSTKWINDDSYYFNASNYTLNKQGDPMERWPEDGQVLALSSFAAR
jgi:REP element-mobilizing transposase RayT